MAVLIQRGCWSGYWRTRGKVLLVSLCDDIVALRRLCRCQPVNVWSDADKVWSGENSHVSKETVIRVLDACEKMEAALDAIDHELGRPRGLWLPAPVVNASDICVAALKLVRGE